MSVALTTAALTALLAAAPPSDAPPSPAPSTAEPPATAPGTTSPSLRRVQHEYDLANYQGDLDLSFANIAYDRQYGELFVGAGENVSVFRKGLKVFQFSTDPQVGTVYSIAPLENGDLLVATDTGAYRFNFRGRLLGPFTVNRAPPGFAGFRPNWVQRVGGKLYLASTPSHRVLVADENGSFLAAYDLAAMIFNNKITDDHDIGGFSVDPNGNLLFTIPALFKAYIVSPDGKVKSFGQPGSRNGNFNVVRSIVRDERGILYIADILRSTVIMFDRNLEFMGEFGGPGDHRGSLAAPTSLAAGDGLLFVSQGAGRGVSMFRIVTD